MQADEAHAVDITSKVFECDPPHRLIYTWARPAEADDESKDSRIACVYRADGRRTPACDCYPKTSNATHGCSRNLGPVAESAFESEDFAGNWSGAAKVMMRKPNSRASSRRHYD